MLNEEQAWVFTYGLIGVTLLLLAWNSRWHLLQGVIFMGVVASNIFWQWTPNTALAAIIGGGLAYAATAGLSLLIQHAERRRQLRTGQHRIHQEAPRVLRQRTRRQRAA